MSDKISLIRQVANGSDWIIGVSGADNQITEFVNKIFNVGGTESGLNYLSENFLYFYTTEIKLKRALTCIFMEDYKRENLWKKGKGSPLGYYFSKIRAAALLDSIKDEIFLDAALNSSNNVYVELHEYN